MPIDFLRGVSFSGLRDGVQLGSITLEDTAVEGSGGYYTPRLVFPTTLEVAPSLSASLIIPELRGTIALADDPDQNYVAVLYEPRARLLGTSVRVQRRVHCDLSPTLVTYIEERRGISDLRLRLRFLAPVFEVSPEIDPPNDDPHSLWLKGGRRHLIAYGEFAANIDLNIPRSIWVDRILPNLGYLHKRLIEFSTPKSDELVPVFREALVELQQADRQFVHGDYDQVIVRCRNAVTALSTAFRVDLAEGEKGQFRPRVRAFNKQVLQPTLGETRGQLVIDVLEALWAPLSAAAKPGGRRADRDYAQLVLNLTSSVLGYLGRALKRAVSSVAQPGVPARPQSTCAPLRRPFRSTAWMLLRRPCPPRTPLERLWNARGGDWITQA